MLAEQIRDSGVAVRLINADVADMDDPELDEPELRRRLGTLVELAHAVGTSTIMLPSGRKGTTPRTELRRDIATVARTVSTAAGIVDEAGLSLLVEAPYSNRLCRDLDRAEMLYEALDRSPEPRRSGRCWTSVTSSPWATTRSTQSAGSTTASVTCICAMRYLGQINISIGRGKVDFPAAIDALTADRLHRPLQPRAGNPRHRRRRPPGRGRPRRPLHHVATQAA